MKRIIAILMAAVLMLSFAACGGKVSFEAAQKQEGGLTEPPTLDEQGNVVTGNFAVPSAGYDGSKVTITFGTTMNQDCLKTLGETIKRFNKLYPNITVEVKSYGGWDTIADLVGKEMNGGNHPNIVYCYPDHVAVYRKAWNAVTLDELVKSTIEVKRADGTTEVLGLTQAQIDDFIPGFYNEGRVYDDGLMYTMPFSKSTELLYYNKTEFDKHPDWKIPTTWEEMEALCRKIKAEDKYAVPLGYDSADNLFITLCEQYGYGYTSATGDERFLFNNDNCKAFVKELREWFQDGLITTKDLYGSYTSNLFLQQDKTQQHSYMCIGSSGGAKNQRPSNGEFEVGIAPIPQVDPANPKVISQGPSVAILKGGKNHTDQHIVASWLLVKFLTTDVEFQATFSMMQGYTPVIKSAQTNPTYKAWLDKADGYTYLTAAAVKESLTQESSYFTSDVFVGSSLARTEVGNLLGACMSEPTTDLNAFIDQKFQATYKKCMESQASK